MQEFLTRAGLSEVVNQPLFIHVAGTNGKGSVTEFVQSLLIAHGYQTGGYFSPYVYDLRERVQFNHEPIPEDDFARIATALRPIGDELESTDFGGPTEFEFKTAVGFAYWTERQADFVSLEVGLGGRLDATNVVTPAVAAIVSIGLDHTAILGNSIAEIAYEKAGIIKSGRPVVVGGLQPEAMDVVNEQVQSMGVPVFRWGHEFHSKWHGERLNIQTPLSTYEDLEIGLYGQIQGQNAAIAVMSLEAAGIALAADSVRSGLASAKIPGRFEVVQWKGKTVILDGAHNLEAMREFVDSFKSRFLGQKAAVITNMVQGHSFERLYTPLLDVADRVVVAPIKFHRALEPEQVAGHLRQFVATETATSIEDALERVLASNQNLVIVTGSFYLVGEIGNAIRAR
ncbi:MAG TPA: folylpolyglutamate synthase/dihydrofolate synthase family protein [Fimbriimonadaceae bacterium]|nr:folylpolyglutamate synthase/dihydrofolate synthase family protein [Fimbriimonadaceae bacterium]